MATVTRVYANMLAEQTGKRLDPERLRRVLDAKSLTEAYKMLADYGFSYSGGEYTIDGFITAETNAFIEFILENAPDDRLRAALLARFEYNNAKLAYKSRFHAVPQDGYYRTALDVTEIADGDYSEADRDMRAALELLDADKVDTPREIDLALTRAMYKHVLDCAPRVAKSYFKAEIDMKNIITAARMKKLGLCSDEFIAGGGVDAATLETARESDDFAECFENTPYRDYACEIAADGFDELWRGERDADDHLFYMTNRSVTDYSTLVPFLNYYTLTLIELKTVKTALVCIKTNARDLFFKRMPAIYAER